MKYFNPKIEELMQTGVRKAKKAGEYLLIAGVVLAPTIGLSGCSSRDNYFNQQRDNAVHAVQNSGQQQEAEASPLPKYSSTPQPEQTVEVNPDLASTPEFRESLPEPIQTPQNNTNTSYKKTDIGMGCYLVEGDFNNDGQQDKAIQDPEGTYYIPGREFVDRIVSAEAVNQYQGTDAGGTKEYTCIEVTLKDESGNVVDAGKDGLFPRTIHLIREIKEYGSRNPLLVIGLGVKEIKLSELNILR